MALEIVDYDERWPVIYGELAEPLREAFDGYAFDVQHVGSTSVPGLAAKPIIDIAVATRDYPLPDEIIRAIEALGYAHKGEFGIPRRHYFSGIAPLYGIPVHVHANVLGSEAWQNHVMFRDYLRAHPDAAQEYARLKRELAAHYGLDRETYTDSKTGFVMETLQKAQRWREETDIGRQ